ncbi:MAG: hypothetical protein WHS44_08100 [Fimbriimonadales bacterium]
MGLTLRQLLEARYELPEVVWQELLTRGYAYAYELAADEQEREEAFDAALAYLKRKGIRLRPKSPEPTLLTLFSSHALSRAFTAIQWGDLQQILNAPLDALTKREQVLRNAIEEFRAKFLPEGAIPVEAIPEWLRAHEQFHPTYWATVHLPREVWERLAQGEAVSLTLSRENVQRLGGDAPTLRYNGYAYRVAPELARAVQELGRFTHWAESQCLEFLLSNAMPDGLPAEAHLTFGLSEGTTYITLRLPAFLVADSVALLYRRLQKRAYGNRKRLQGIQERIAELIRFVEAYRAQNPKARWREVAGAWNAHCLQQQRPPEWRASESTLKRHYERYIRTVLELVRGSPAGESV